MKRFFLFILLKSRSAASVSDGDQELLSDFYTGLRPPFDNEISS